MILSLVRGLSVSVCALALMSTTTSFARRSYVTTPPTQAPAATSAAASASPGDAVAISRAFPTADLPTVPTIAAESVNVNVTINASQIVRTVDDRMFGVNTAVWDDHLKAAETLPLLRAIDMRTLRFPGGSTSDTYNWKVNKSYDSATGALNNWSWSTSFDEFAPTAVALGANVFITVNYGSGTAQEAADWVTYANVTKGYGFKYWEIGNEEYGSWEYDTHASKHDPVTYANEAKDFITKMKAADATVKVGIVVVDGEESYSATTRTAVVNPRTSVAHKGWTPILLAQLKVLGVTPDFAIFHRYPFGPGNESDANLLGGRSQSGTTWAEDIAGLRQQLNDYLGAVEGPKVEIIVTENNSVFSDTGKQTTSLVNALYLADSVGNLLQAEVNGFMWWTLRNGPQDKTHNNSASLYGWRNYGDYGIVAPGNATETPVSTPYPTYHMMKLLSYFARGGDQVVSVTSATPLLAVYAVKRANGTLTILAINKSPTQTFSTDFALNGFTPASRAAVRTYGIPQDEAARIGTGSTEMELSSLGSVGATFSASFAPYSCTLLTLYPVATSSSRIINLSVRANAASGAETLIVGFVVGGAGTSGQLPVLVRALGPKLTQLGVTGAVPNPDLALHTSVGGSDSVAATNDDWSNGAADLSTQFQRLGAAGLTSGSKDAAWYGYVDAKPYGAHVNAPQGSGVALAEVYDGSSSATTSTPRLVNISGRAQVNRGDNVLIAGFVIAGDRPKTVLIRGLGPRLGELGVAGSLVTPKLELHATVRGQDTVLATNTAWGGSTDLVTLFNQLGAAALPSLTSADAALVVTLEPGVYSAVVSGVGTTTGVALVEIYEVD